MAWRSELAELHGGRCDDKETKELEMQNVHDENGTRIVARSLLDALVYQGECAKQLSAEWLTFSVGCGGKKKLYLCRALASFGALCCV